MAMASSGSTGVSPLFRFVLLCFVLLTAGAVDAQVLFKESLNLDYWSRYAAFMATVRGKPALRDGTTHSLPILPKQVDPPTRFFDVELSFTAADRTTKRVTVRVRGDNLYLIGYQPGSTAGKWFELKGASTTGRQVIPGSTILGFSGDYGALARVAGRGREQTDLGHEPLKNAVSALDKAAAVAQAAQASALLVLIQMVSEAARFRTITNVISRAPAAGFKPDAGMIELENNWSALSAALLLQDHDPNAKFPIRVPNKMKINNFAEAAAALGIVLRTS